MSHIITSQLVHIRSKDGVGFQAGIDGQPVRTGFTIMLNSPIRCLPHQSLYASLNSLEMLFSFFTCDETNNELVVVMQYPGCVAEYHTQRYEDATGNSFIKGNYDVDSLKLAFEAKVNATMADGGFADFNNGGGTNKFIVDYRELTNSYYFALEWDDTTGAIIGTPNVYFVWDTLVDGQGPPNDPICRMLGMTGNTNFVMTVPNAALPATPTFPDDYAFTDSVVDIGSGRLDSLYCRTDLTSTSSISSYAKSFTDVLQKIPVNAKPNSFIFFYPQQSEGEILLRKKSITSITIQLTDEIGRLVDTNNVDWTLTLKFSTAWTPQFTLSSSVRRLTDAEEKVIIQEGETHVEALQRLREANLRKRVEAMKKIKPPKKRDRKLEQGNQAGKLGSERSS